MDTDIGVKAAMDRAIKPSPAQNGEEQAYRRGVQKGIKEGCEKGLRAMLLEIVRARKIPLNAWNRRQIASESSPFRLRQWGRRAITARSSSEIFAH